MVYVVCHAYAELLSSLANQKQGRRPAVKQPNGKHEQAAGVIIDDKLLVSWNGSHTLRL